MRWKVAVGDRVCIAGKGVVWLVTGYELLGGAWCALLERKRYASGKTVTLFAHPSTLEVHEHAR